MKKIIKLGVAIIIFLVIFIAGSIRTNENSILDLEDKNLYKKNESTDYLDAIDLYADEEIVTYYEDYEWNVLHTKKVLDRTYVSGDTGELEEREDYILVPFIYIDEEQYYIGNTTEDMLVIYYDYNKSFIGGSSLEATSGKLLEIPQNAAYISFVIPAEDFEEVWLASNGSSQKLFAVVDKEGTYKTISSAVKAIEDNGTILVLSGTYNECVNAWGKTVNIIGTSREECILISYSSNYHSPPLKISSGMVKNMTITAKKSNGETTKLKAYAVHVEDHNLADNELIFENCNISSDYNSGIGMGLRGGCVVTISNCSLAGKEYGLFCHDSAYSNYVGVQNVIINNTTFEGKSGNKAVLFDSQGLSGTTVNVTFNNVSLINGSIKDKESLIEVRNNGRKGDSKNWMGLYNYYLTKESKDNVCELLNYK